MREAIDGPSSSSLPLSDQRSDPEEPDVLDQIDAYVEEEMDILEEIDHYQSDESEEEEAIRPVNLLLMQVFPLMAPVFHVLTRCHKF